MFVENNAFKEYFKLVEDANTRVSPNVSRKEAKKILGYCERHHIIPRSLGGLDDTSNLVWFTAFEHLKAHILLVHMSGDTPTKHKTSLAAIRMINPQDHKHKRIYEADISDDILLEIAAIKEESARLHSAYMSERVKGENNPFFGKTQTEESNEARRQKLKGVPKPAGSIINYRNSKLGDKNPATKTVTCPKCGEVGKAGGMRKHHFDRCIKNTVFNLQHVSGETFTGTRDEFTEHIKAAKWLHVNIGGLLRGTRDEFDGWTVRK